MPSIQTAYHIQNRARVGTRTAQWINPKQGELLISSREQAYQLIEQLEDRLKESLPRHKKAEILVARSMIYEATGDQKMMDAARDAWRYTKTSTTAHMMAVAYHHFGDLENAVRFYEQAYRYPHEAGFNVDLAYTQALLFKGDWTEAHKQTLKLKKRMVYAAYLPEWDRKPCKELSLISEGGFGDIIHTGRWIPTLRQMVDKLTIYLPPYFFEHGFADLMQKQNWCPEIKLLTETPMKVPAVGFFDLPAVFNVQPDTIPDPLPFQADCTKSYKFRDLYGSVQLPKIGFCWAARQQETPIVPDGIYRSLTSTQMWRIVQASLHPNGEAQFRLFKLQKEYCDEAALMSHPKIESWEDTAAIIENLDAVITVDTAVMHLAASMGKPTFALLSGASDWKFGMSGDKCLWYPSIKLFRNEAFGFDHAVNKFIEFVKNGQFHHYLGEHRRLCENVS
jgi:tetratricopeptide (TPR) repeat protein